MSVNRGDRRRIIARRRGRWTRRATRRRTWWSFPSGGEKGFSDTNYIFLSFVTKYLPAGLVGLVIAVIFAATMSASSGEVNSLATVTVVDLYRRLHPRAADHHYVVASRIATLFWGAYAVVFAGWGKRLGSLIVAVNVGRFAVLRFMLGCFVLEAFGFRKVRGTATFGRECWWKWPSSWAFLFTNIFVAVVQRTGLRGSVVATALQRSRT